jgi:hypothetical protein
VEDARMADTHETGHRLDHLMELRAGIFEEMEELEREMVTLRMRVERTESDLRLGEPEPDDYARWKGHDLPSVEGRLVQAFNNLLKLEEKILFTRMGQGRG